MLRKLAFCLILSASAFGAEAKRLDVGSLNVTMWKPEGPVPSTGYPLIVFSHGFTGCATQSKFLMQALAEAGYFVLAPNHKDSSCAGREQSGGIGRYRGIPYPEEPFQNDKKWTDQTYRDRWEDIESLLNAVLASKSFEGVPIDAAKIGLAGHSLGGYTVLGLAGAWPSWKDKRIKAVAALSPYCNPYVDNGDLKHMGVPVMYQGGTRDLGVTPTVRRLNGAYDHSSAPRYYIEFDGAGHFAWTDLNPRFQKSIDAYTIAFFDRYVKGQVSPDPLAPLVAKKGREVSYLRVDK